jgi:hypothetical protein
MSPFLFVLAAEGLNGLLSKAVELKLFSPFMVGDEGPGVTHLQFSDDTILVGVPTFENLWCLKAVLRSFEMVSGMKINFYKSKLVGKNVDADFMTMASCFLHCKIGGLPFQFLGIPVGVNPRKVVTWNPVLEAMRSRLGSWQNKFLSLGGRVTFLNSVLNSIPIHWLSFYKMPRAIVKEITRLQRNFLWAGTADNHKIPWVRWSQVCKRKEEGGLGVKNVEDFNKSLLCKWLWRILTNDNKLWCKLVRARMGVDDELFETRRGAVRISSVWWEDICRIGKENNGLFFKEISKRLGSGESVKFWKEVWLGTEAFAVMFPRLISSKKNGLVNQMGDWDGEI